MCLGIGNGVSKQGRGSQPPLRRYGPNTEIQYRPQKPHRLAKTRRNSLRKGSRYRISVSTPHRRYGHRLRTPFLRTPSPRLLMWVPFYSHSPGNPGNQRAKSPNSWETTFRANWTGPMASSSKVSHRVENAPTCYRAPTWPDPEFPRKIPKNTPRAPRFLNPNKIPQKIPKKNTKNEHFWYFGGIFPVFSGYFGGKFWEFRISVRGVFFRYFSWKFWAGPGQFGLCSRSGRSQSQGTIATIICVHVYLGCVVLSVGQVKRA